MTVRHDSYMPLDKWGHHDETKCSAMCIRLQHGKKIVEEPEMIKCTTECKWVHVVEVK